MQIQIERLYLFETSVKDPYFLGTRDGVEVTFTADNARNIETLEIETVYFYFDVIGKCGLSYSMGYGGEDNDILNSYGKSQQSYTLEVNMPTDNQRFLEELVGKQFSLLAMRRDLTHFVIFGQFECDNLDIDNELIKRVRFKTNNTNARLLTVNSFNITEIINVIDGGAIADDGGFDYGFDFTFS